MSPEATSLRPAGRRARLAALAVALVLVAAVIATVTLSNGRERQARADAAGADGVLRVTRLAGYAGAAAQVRSGEAVVRLVFPSHLITAADVQLGWATGMAMLTAACPHAGRYRVDLVGPVTQNLVSVTARGEDARAAVAADDVAALRAALSFTAYANGAGPPFDGTAKSTSGRESELDEANRSAGFVSETGPATGETRALKLAWDEAKQSAEGVPAPSGGIAETVAFWSTRVTRALDSAPVEGENELRAAIPGWAADGDVTRLRAWAAVVGAIASKRPVGERVLGLTADITRDVLARGGRGGGPSKYADAKWAVMDLMAVPTLDASGSADSTGVVGMALARWGVARDGGIALPWRSEGADAASGPIYAGADTWRAHRAGDGRVYWLAGDGGDVALTDTTLRGWGYEVRSVGLVDAGDISRVLAVFPPKDEQ